MKLHLENNSDGTSNGFIVTKSKIVMVYHDHMLTFENSEKGKEMIDAVLNSAINLETYEQLEQELLTIMY